MHPEVLREMSLDWSFVTALFNVVTINLILSGDNAVVIAMAVRSLPRNKRAKGMILGAGGAILLMILFTFFVSQLLYLQFIKLLGGMAIIWIALKLLVEGTSEETRDKDATSVLEAVKILVVANITMSLDNILAVAAASHGHVSLLVLGLGLSIPIVLFASNFLAALMDRYPFISYIGAGILGKVGGDMIVTDPFIVDHLAPSIRTQYIVQALFALGVIAGGTFWLKRTNCKIEADERRSHMQASLKVDGKR